MKYLVLCLIVMGIISPNPQTPTVSKEQKAAHQILTTKCNVCHTSKNPSKVFTLKNMNGFARKINRQVFVWKRMPKGKEVSLSKKEKEQLKTWIKIQLN